MKRTAARTGCNWRFCFTSPLSAQDLVSQPQKRARGEAQSEAADWLREQLSDGEAHEAREMWTRAEDAGLSERTVRRALKALNVVVEQVPPRPGGKWFWTLPDGPDCQLYNTGSLGAGNGNSEPGNGESEQISQTATSFPQTATSQDPSASGSLANGPGSLGENRRRNGADSPGDGAADEVPVDFIFTDEP